jgi:hypothetical protein
MVLNRSLRKLRSGLLQLCKVRLSRFELLDFDRRLFFGQRKPQKTILGVVTLAFSRVLWCINSSQIIESIRGF